MIMTKGNIVLALFPFTDLTGSKRRPAVIVSSSTKKGDDVILAFISSKVDQPIQSTDFVIDQDHPDFKATGLKVRSVFKMDKIVTLEKRILRGEIGIVSQSILNKLNQRLRLALDL